MLADVAGDARSETVCGDVAEMTKMTKFRKPRSTIVYLGDGVCGVEIDFGENALTALIDIDDAEMVGKYRWIAEYSPDTKTYYARSSYSVKMHRLITNCPGGKMVDHINGDTLDNRRKNLRIATSRINQNNRKDSKGYAITRIKTGWQLSMNFTKNCRTVEDVEKYKRHFAGLRPKLMSMIDLPDEQP